MGDTSTSASIARRLTTLHNVNIHAFREISYYLESRDLLAFWQSNDSRIQALLRNSNSIKRVIVDCNSEDELMVVRSWLKSQDKPRLGQLRISDYGDGVLGMSNTYEQIARFLLRYGEVEKVIVDLRSLKSIPVLAEQWSKAIRSRSRYPFVFPGTTAFTIIASLDSSTVMRSPITLLHKLPDTVENLTLSSHLFPSGPLPLCLRNLLTLKLTARLQDVEMGYDKSVTPAPIYWPFLAKSLPLLRSLVFDFKVAIPGYWELPASLTHLSMCFHSRERLLMFLPSTLESLSLLHPKRDAANGQSKPGIQSVNRELFWRHIQQSAITSLETLCEPFSKLVSASADEFITYYGKDLLSKLAPSGSSESWSLEAFIEEHVESTVLSSKGLIDRFPNNLVSLKFSNWDFHEIEDFTKAITQRLPLLATLQLYYDPSMQLFRPARALSPPAVLTFPSTLTSFQSSFTGEYLPMMLPETLKYLELPFKSVRSVSDVRKKFGPHLALVCVGEVFVRDTELHLAFPNTWKPRITYQMFLDGLAALLGSRTTASLVIVSASWPSNLSIVDFEVPQGGLTPSRGISVTLSDAVFLRSPTLTHLNLSHLGRHRPGSIQRLFGGSGGVISAPLKFLELGPGVDFSDRLWALLPSTLTSLKHHYTSKIVGWDKSVALLPNLTRLEVPNENFDLESTALPAGLRFLSIRLKNAMRDVDIRDKLSALKDLESLNLRASDVIFTAPEWPSAVVNRDNVLSGLETYFGAGRLTFKLELSDMSSLEVSVQDLPQNLTSLDLLCYGRQTAVDLTRKSRWPAKLTSLKAGLSNDYKHAWPLDELPLTELHAHLDLKVDEMPKLPPSVESVMITSEKGIASARRLKTTFVSLPPTLPCSATLVCLMAPHFSLITPEAPTPTKGKAKPKPKAAGVLELPNLIRLSISGQGSSDLDVASAIEKRFPKLERLSVYGALILTGALTRDSDSVDVTFESIALETQEALLALLEKSYRRRVTRERSSNPSELKGASKKVKRNSPASDSEAHPDLEESQAVTTKANSGDLKAFLACFWTVDVAYKTPFSLPLLTKRLTLMGHPKRREATPETVSLAMTSMGTDPASEIESLILERSQASLVHVASNFSVESIGNFDALFNLCEVEYDSMVTYTPGPHFDHSTLQKLVIHAAIKSQIVGAWVLPPNLTYLEVTRLAKSVKFTCAKSLPCSNLRTLVLPNVTWKSSDALPANLSRLVVLKFDPVEFRPVFADPKCEIVMSS